MNGSPFSRILIILWLASGSLLFAQSARDRAVEINATVQETPPTIALQWTVSAYSVVEQKLYRRLKDAPAWNLLSTMSNSATSYIDAAVSPGVSYEYFVSRTFNGAPLSAAGYVSAGIRAPLVADRGRVILLVDDTMAAPLATELGLFISDLTGDGWTVVRQDVSRDAAPPSIRAAIQGIYASAPTHTTSLILFGHIPVPYSGDFAIDGHPDHFGAWPTDVYYGDMDGTWTDSLVNDTGAGQVRNQNIPGDGKFDQTVIPSDIELQVGRIDLANMPTFGVSETTLLRQYLDRDHRYRHNLDTYATVGRRGLVDDNFGYFNGEAFAVTAWRSFTACVGAGNVQELDWFDTLQTQSYLWALGCGGGNFGAAGGVGSTSDFVTKDSRAVFNVSFGSYFGDWDVTDNYLRAPLAGTANSLGLASCWSGRPHWQFHQMALGETLGYCARATQNNRSGVALGYDSNLGERFNHIALLGDPTLRLYPVEPPSNLTATPSTQSVALSWTAPIDGLIEGYLVSRATSPNGPFIPLRGALVTGTGYVDRTALPGTSYTYLVRAVKLQTSPTGTFLNPSQGVFSSSAITGNASGPEFDLSANGRPVSADDTATLASNGTDFGSVEVGQSFTQFFTIANPGTTTLSIGSIGLSGSQAGDFNVSVFPPSSIAAGASATFQIRFHPSAVGSRSTVLTLTSNDADEPTYAFAIGGTGLTQHAEIAVYPPAINRSIHAGDTVAETINISDPGPGALTHTIANSLDRYSARNSDSFGGPTYSWIDISSTGTEVSGWLNADDNISDPIALGFAFPFYSNTFTSVRIGTNGYLTFTDTATSASNSSLPSTSAATNLIALLWADLYIDASSHVYWQQSGGNFIVQFQNASFYGTGSTRVTCEGILKPTGEILLQYKTLTQLGSTYTIGIQNGTRDDGLLVSYNTASAHDGLAIRLRPPAFETWLSLSGNFGTVPAGQAQSLTATLNASGLALGSYYAELTVTSNAQGNGTVVIPVRLTVGNTPMENWRSDHFGTTTATGNAADDANPDTDTHSNLLEYALSTDPQQADAFAPPGTQVNNSGYLQIQFTRDPTRTDLRYIVEASSDLTGNWTPIASSIHGAPIHALGAHAAAEITSGALQSVTVEDTSAANTFTTRYLRLQVLRD